VLRAGTDSGWGVAVVCGAGINCVGVAPDGRQARFPSLGAITGDWGGGYDLGMGALWAAARSEDGRGEKTSLEHAVPAHFGLDTPLELAAAIHTGKIRTRRVVELAPLVLAAADEDPVAAELTERLAGEVVTMARVALERLDLLERPVEVVLGGGVLGGGNGNLLGAIEAGLHAVSPNVSIHPPAAPPIVGAALLALDEVGADPETLTRARAALQEASRG
jgi:N-acetylglucosamine kinase-like BadF-type ATPase